MSNAGLAQRACQALRSRRRISTTTLFKGCRRKLATVQDDPAPLKDVEDWTEMQQSRAQRKAIDDHFTGLGSTQTRENTWQPHHSLHRPPSPHELTVSALIAAGAHLGHSTSLVNPNFIPYAYGTRAGITIIDLDHTVPLLRRATNLVRAVAANGGTVIFVGSRPDIREAAKKAADRMGPLGFYVGERWLPGTLTNKLQLHSLQDVRDFKINPDLMVFLNPIPNMAAIRECAIEHIPTIGIVDSNVDPRIVMYPIPANDESTRTAELIAGVLSIAGREGIELGLKTMEEEVERTQDIEVKVAKMRNRA